MLKICGNIVSVPTNKVRFVANKLGLDYEFVSINLAEGEHTKDWFLKLNPVGKVPVMDDDGFILFESNTITKYLSDKNRSSLYPQDLHSRVNVDKWIDFISLHVAAALTRVFFNRVLAPYVNVEVDERSLSDGLVFLKRFLPVVDNQLKENNFLAGEDLTLADFNLLAGLDPAEIAQVDLSPYSHLTRWREGLKQEEFYTRCHSCYEEALQSLGN